MIALVKLYVKKNAGKSYLFQDTTERKGKFAKKSIKTPSVPDKKEQTEFFSLRRTSFRRRGSSYGLCQLPYVC